jgi:hypothetical protein
MLSAQDRFKRLSDKFEALVLEMGKCGDPKRRSELLQRMKIVIDEIDGLIFTSLDRESKQTCLTDPKLSTDSSSP